MMDLGKSFGTAAVGHHPEVQSEEVDAVVAGAAVAVGEDMFVERMARFDIVAG